MWTKKSLTYFLSNIKRHDPSLTCPKEEDCDSYLAQGINVVQHYDLYYPMFELLYPHDRLHIASYPGNFSHLVQEKGYQEAYLCVVKALTR